MALPYFLTQPSLAEPRSCNESCASGEVLRVSVGQRAAKFQADKVGGLKNSADWPITHHTGSLSSIT